MPALDLTATSADLTRTICDIPSVSGDETTLADLIFAEVSALPHLEVYRDGDTIVARHRRSAYLAACGLLAVVAHIAFKQLFDVGDTIRFAELGMAERTTWQVLLAVVGVGLAALAQNSSPTARAGHVVAAAGLAHFAMFSFFLHNPLWAEQSVGSWPIANLLLVSYGVAIGLALRLRASLGRPAGKLRPAFDAVVMMLIAMLALSELRQLYAGAWLLGPVTENGVPVTRVPSRASASGSAPEKKRRLAHSGWR